MDKKKLVLTAMAGILAVAPAFAGEGKASKKSKKAKTAVTQPAGENHCKAEAGHCGASKEAGKEGAKAEMSCGANGCQGKGEKAEEKAATPPAETK